VLRAKVFVFVELFRKAKEIRRQAEELAAYRVELERRLDQLVSLNEELQRLSRTTAEARDQAQAASHFMSLVVESVPNGIVMVDQNREDSVGQCANREDVWVPKGGANRQADRDLGARPV